VGAQWCNLANTVEPPICGGDAAFFSNYFDHLLLLLVLLISWYHDAGDDG